MRIKMTKTIKTNDTPPVRFSEGMELMTDAKELKARGVRADSYEVLGGEAKDSAGEVRTSAVPGPSRPGPKPTTGGKGGDGGRGKKG